MRAWLRAAVIYTDLSEENFCPYTLWHRAHALAERLTTMEEIEHPRYIPILVGDDRTFYVEVLTLDDEEEVAARRFGLEDLAQSIGAVAETVTDSITSALHKVQPGKVIVEFGCEVGLDTGHLTAILVKGAAKANVRVTVEWTPQQRG
jgi:hypothetical protein